MGMGSRCQDTEPWLYGAGGFSPVTRVHLSVHRSSYLSWLLLAASVHHPASWACRFTRTERNTASIRILVTKIQLLINLVRLDYKPYLNSSLCSHRRDSHPGIPKLVMILRISQLPSAAGTGPFLPLRNLFGEQIRAFILD